MGAIGADTAVQGESADGVGRYRADLCEDWRIWGPNGGYLASIALRAVGAHTGRVRPASLTAQFLRVARFGEVELELETVRGTRRADCVHVTMRQEGKAVFTAQVWAVDEVPGLVHDHAPMPEVPPPHECKTPQEVMAEAGVERERPPFPFWDNFDERPLAWVADWESYTGGDPRAIGWYRYAHERASADPWVDAARPVILVDTFTWPAAVRAHGPTDFFAPSLDLAVSLHHDPSDSEWLLIEGFAPIAHRGTIGCTGRVWTEDGRLAAFGTGTLLCISGEAP